ncbi:hypothetical protein DL89DRAFT_289504 [Linderina pennispora]|uniref:3-oxo-5-alpha-steroid 4-dehydrogenase C-terminal domain-containing protein n=1 Tax=Linderina pennispora TaxID=61395 RepID=A0A1Y1WJS8_9FUNG|nr:uncharacterized protein DL89DRAFT_289504 [Linderina pennispora]ORX73797.1 hypothetical protein DL89DRAFT_289504 [Linderina pennispora]
MFLAYLSRLVFTSMATVALTFEAVPWMREAFIKYGKTRPVAKTDPTSLLGRFARATVSKNMFAQFYAIGVIVSAALTADFSNWYQFKAQQAMDAAPERFYFRFYMQLEYWLLGATRESFIDAPTSALLLAMGMYNLHVILRLYETVYHQPATKAQMHVGHYLVGLVHYVFAPLGIISDAIYTPGWVPANAYLVLTGMAVFAYASIHQWRCHHILYKLRFQSLREERERREREAEAETSAKEANVQAAYVIPTGDLFRYVSSPHYLCEILVYIALWLVTSCQSTTILIMTIWSASQKWYKSTFGDKFPRNRRALIPFVW